MGRQRGGAMSAPNLQGGVTRPQGYGGGGGIGGMGRQLGGMAQTAMQRPEVQQGMEQARGWLQGAGMPQTMAGTPQMGLNAPQQQVPGAGDGYGTAQPVGINRPPAKGMQPPQGMPRIDPQMLAQMLQSRQG